MISPHEAQPYSLASPPVPERLAPSIIDHVLQAFDFLENLSCRKPRADLDKRTMELTALLRLVYPRNIVEAVLENAGVKAIKTRLIQLLGECEYELERFWAENIASREIRDYARYPEINSYYSLVASESRVLSRYMALDGQKVCFIGSGPMPLTAFELQRCHPTLEIIGVEMEEDAVRCADKVCENLGIDMRYILSKAEELDYAAYDLVFVASMTINKKAVFSRIQQTARDGTIIAARTVEGLRKLLYEPIAADMLPDGLHYLEKTPYLPLHVNTTLFYRLQKQD